MKTINTLENYLSLKNFLTFLSLFTLCVLFSITEMSAQTTFQKIFGGTASEGGQSENRALGILQTADTGYIVVARTSSFGAGGSDIYVIKMDNSGDTTWTRAYGGPGNELGCSIFQTADGGYVIAARTDSFGAGGNDLYLVRIDGSGTLIWGRACGLSTNEVGRDVVETSDNGYMIAGSSEVMGGGNSDGYLLRTDVDGVLVFAKTYGGINNEYFAAMDVTSDGGYILAGNTSSYGAGNTDAFLVKTDANGDTMWAKAYGGTNGDLAYDVKQTTDGGYILVGETTSFGPGSRSVLLIKTDASGDTLWSKTIGGLGSGGPPNGDYAEGYSIQQTSDLGYIIAGEMYGMGPAGNNFYMILTDASGNVAWTKTYGGSNEDNARSVVLTDDGGYIFAGYTSSFGAGSTDIMIIKTDASGISGTCYLEDITSTVTSPAPTITNATPTIGASGLINSTTTIESGAATEVNDFKLKMSTFTNPAIIGNSDGEAIVLVSGGVPPYTYLWDDPAAQTTYIASNLAAGKYTVIVTDASGCEDTTSAVIFEVTGIVNNDILSTLNISPNPNNGQFDIDIQLTSGDLQSVSIYRYDGSLIYQEMLSGHQDSHYQQHIDISQFSASMYLLKLVTDESVITRKIVRK